MKPTKRPGRLFVVIWMWRRVNVHTHTHTHAHTHTQRERERHSSPTHHTRSHRSLSHGTSLRVPATRRARRIFSTPHQHHMDSIHHQRHLRFLRLGPSHHHHHQHRLRGSFEPLCTARRRRVGTRKNKHASAQGALAQHRRHHDSMQLEICKHMRTLGPTRD